mgnify:CR=1 FL=1
MIKRAVSDSEITGIGSSFDLTKVIKIDMGMFPLSAPLRSKISLITAQFSNMSTPTSPSTATIRICRDILGDHAVLTETDSSIFSGLTTSTKGTAIWSIEGNVCLDSNDYLYIFIKSNTGSFDVEYIEINWNNSGK